MTPLTRADIENAAEADDGVHLAEECYLSTGAVLALLDRCEAAEARRDQALKVADIAQLFGEIAAKQAADVLDQRDRALGHVRQLVAALLIADGSHQHVPTCAGDNEAFNAPGGLTYCPHCNANLARLRQVRAALAEWQKP